ncbi:type VI secretion system baseplate subunit TssF [Massilia solisilvae]|uniref:Type VI secretion system baseplate subunit TssF n=1 Tax=Massilia solisilvae TaxID=1811225 RepID=A0ABT2BNS1_9BURK|nr:type VI secretion system baseplate subunit TssF [Massilia solisilvae]MCS0609528.1 type VI secretion system baseplate subunit TssF [Massilia solisilvae]
MDELLRYFEEELGLFGQYAREFRNRFPKPASDLHLAGDNYEDPSVARLIQSVALLSARIRKRLDDDYPKFTEALLESLYPHYLRPMPSYSVAQVSAGEAGQLATLPRGTALRASAVEHTICQFRTVYDVTPGALAVVQAGFSSMVNAPRSLRLPRGVSGCISMTFACTNPASHMTPDCAGTLRLFVDGEPSLRAALIDALFMRTACAYLQSEPGASWARLERVPLRLAGFADDDAMIPLPARSHPAFRLLAEYFVYPEKFHFIDLQLAELLPLLPARCQRFTLHLALSGVPADSVGARLLAPLAHKNLLPGCTPVINLFDKAGVPVQLSHTSADYALVADVAHAGAYEIYSVDQVRLVREGAGGGRVTDFSPLYAVRHDTAHNASRNYWLTRRDDATAAVSPGHELRISLIDAEFSPTAAAGATLSTELTCTNRDLPSQLRYGHPEGDLRADGLAGAYPIRMLRRPTPSYRFASGNGAHWRLVTHLALNHAQLTNAGLGDFQKMLALYDLVRTPISQRQVNGIVGLEHGAVRAWVKTLPASTLMPGIAVRMTVDEEAFVGSSLYVFAQVMDRFFALNAQLNCFTQLTLVSEQTGQEIVACPPRTAENTRA